MPWASESYSHNKNEKSLNLTHNNVFSTSVEGCALNWYRRLTLESINSFADLSLNFMENCALRIQAFQHTHGDLFPLASSKSKKIKINKSFTIKRGIWRQGRSWFLYDGSFFFFGVLWGAFVRCYARVFQCPKKWHKEEARVSPQENKKEIYNSRRKPQAKLFLEVEPCQLAQSSFAEQCLNGIHLTRS